jgi:2-aminobenzoate-CoA ligase
VVLAYVVLRAGEQASPEMAKALQDHVKQLLAPYKYPRRIEFRSSLPRTETGKLQRFKLRQEAKQLTESA